MRTDLINIIVGAIIGVTVLIIGIIIGTFWDSRTSQIPPAPLTITPGSPPPESTHTLEPATPMPTLTSLSTSVPIATPTFTPVPTPTNTPMPTPTPTSTPMPATPTSTLYDDFNSASIDQSKWIPPSNENLIYQADRVLNLINAQPAEDTVGTSLRATGAGRPIREISFLITLQSYQENISGGAGLGLYLDSGRDLYVDVGPGPNGPGIEFSICRNPACSGYEEYDHPDGGPFPVGIATPIRVRWTGQRVEFYVKDVLRVVQAQDSSPIVEFRFTMYADPGSVYYATVDDVHVLYAD